MLYFYDMMSTDVWGVTIFLVTLLLVQVLYLFVRRLTSANRRLPGPFPWPVVGNAIQLGDNLHITLSAWRKLYGDVFQIKMGSRTVVVFNGRNAIVDLLGGNKPEFSARPNLESAKYINEGKSFVFALLSPEKNRYYKKLVNNCVNNLVLTRDQVVKKGQFKDGVGTESRLSVIEELLMTRSKPFVERLIKVSKEETGSTELKEEYITGGRYSPVFSEMSFEMSLLFYRLLYGDTSIDHREYIRKHISLTDEFGKIIGNANLYDVMPWIKYVRPGYLNRFIRLVGLTFTMFKGQLENRTPHFRKMVQEASSLDEIHPTNIVDALLKECEKRKNTKNYDRQLTLNIGADLLGAAFDTAPKAFEWVLSYSAVFPDIQDKIRSEIDEFILENKRIPLYEERGKLCRTWSFILEVFRHASPLPMTVPHAPIKKGLMINGCIVPDDCMIFVNQWSANHDPELWGTPEHFRPERFLSVDGFLKQSMENQILTFGIGRRKCPGKSITEIEIFHLFVALVYHAIILPGPGMVTIPKAKFGLVLMAEEGNLQIVRREKIPIDL